MENNNIRDSINEAVSGIRTERFGEDVRSCISSAVNSSEEYITENLAFIEETSSKMDEYSETYNEAKNTYDDFCSTVEIIHDIYEKFEESFNAFKNGPWGKVF